MQALHAPSYREGAADDVRTLDLPRFERKLLDLRASVLGRHRLHVAPVKVGEGPEPDELDRAARAQEGGTVVGLAEADRRLLHEIDDALERIADGTYGLCEGTGAPIDVRRLEIRPWARHTVQHEEQLEKARGGLRRTAI